MKAVMLLNLVLFTTRCQKGTLTSSDTEAARPGRIGDLSDAEVPYPDQEVSIRGRYAAISKNLFSGQMFRETGSDRSKALQRALALCRIFAEQEAGCVVIRSYNTALLPTYGDGLGSWNCFVETNPIAGDPLTFRTWMGAGKTVREASLDAQRRCTLRSGFPDCRLVRCFNDDVDKVF